VSYRLKTAVVLLMLAFMPLRALAAVTIGFCAMQHHGTAAATGEYGASHEHGAPDGEGNHEQCNACVEHCASASVAASPDLPLPAVAGAQRIAAAERFAAGFILDQLDRPPLAR
jgi:hypothetical protein